jgi:3-dehydroquinate dehydratase/shikimate dehydrogenase
MSMICVSIAVSAADEVGRALERASRAAATGARLIEWRIDALVEDCTPPAAIAAATRLVRDSPAPCIVTCRDASEGGEYRGDEATRISLMEALAAADHPPRYIDIELAAMERSANLRQKVLLAVAHQDQPCRLQTSLILSSHDVRGRPADLIQRIERMTSEPACAVVKVAWTARSLRDNLEAFDLLAERRKPMVALCMGRFGLMSRVLAGKFGGLLTFATDGADEATAPGQPSIDDLVNLYRFDRIGAATKVYGVIGWPVEHSHGPRLHNAGFGAIGFDGVYLPLPIPPEWEHFKATLGALIDHPRLEFRGASVTIPHKEHLVRFVKERGGRLDLMSERTGAANTLVVGSAGGLECINTDAPAAVQALCGGLGLNAALPGALDGLRIAVIGAGGVARAVAAGMLDSGATVVIFNRSAARAEGLVAELRRSLDTAVAAGARPGTLAAGAPGALGCGCFHVFINCTPMGMKGGPDPDGSPLDLFPDSEEVRLDQSMTVMDTVYTPARTPLIREAESRGVRVIAGGDMYLRQAAMQFERWTGCRLPSPVASAGSRP